MPVSYNSVVRTGSPNTNINNRKVDKTELEKQQAEQLLILTRTTIGYRRLNRRVGGLLLQNTELIRKPEVQCV